MLLGVVAVNAGRQNQRIRAYAQARRSPTTSAADEVATKPVDATGIRCILSR